MVATRPRRVTTPVEQREAEVRSARPWRTIVWNDPVNLMSYVTYVFRTYFGYSEGRARELMLQVHHKGLGVAGVYTFEVAETKAFQVNEFSKENGYPLKTTVEKE